MASYTVRQGKRYRATISLSWIEQIASNDRVAQPIREAGFAEVKVVGLGRTRLATALWPREDATAEIPDQIISISEIEV
jgi:hypothetical protein